MQDGNDNVRYEYDYENCVCVGEMIRNICVNLGIDPDTVDGITRNIQVWKVNKNERNLWNYNPYDSIDFHSIHGEIQILLREISKH